MNKIEAREILANELRLFRDQPWEELREMMNKPRTFERIGSSGKNYQIEIQAFWDGKPEGDLRITGAIDDGGIRVYFPLTDSFILSPNGEFVGE